MKANELMIGDWVLAEGKPLQVTNISVLGGDTICVMNPFMSYDTMYSSNIVALSKGAKDINEIEPIPLTEEILEKNGYKCRDWWYEQEGYPDITNVFTDNMYEVGKHTYYGNGQPEFSSIIKIRYVHELQHALKLCGIEKEIVL